MSPWIVAGQQIGCTNRPPRHLARSDWTGVITEVSGTIVTVRLDSGRTVQLQTVGGTLAMWEPIRRVGLTISTARPTRYDVLMAD